MHYYNFVILGNQLYAGDHVSWHCGLDGSESRLQHMLMGEDPQLQFTVTPHGSVRFVQIVGACLEELQSVQRWNGPGVLQILKRHSMYVNYISYYYIFHLKSDDWKQLFNMM